MDLTIKKLKMNGMKDFGYFVAYDGFVCEKKYMAQVFEMTLFEYQIMIEDEFHAIAIKGWLTGDTYYYFKTKQEAENFIIIAKLSRCS